MQQVDLVRFLSLLGYPQPNPIVRDSRLYLTCPLAAMRHSHGIDSHPSANISISDEKQSYYRCFGCMDEGRPLEWLLHKIWVQEQEYPYEASSFLAQNECWSEEDGVDENSWLITNVTSKKWDKYLSYQVPLPIPKAAYEKLPALSLLAGPVAKRAFRWLESRGITGEIIDRFALRYHARQELIIFPYTSVRGLVYGLEARVIGEKSMFAYKPSKLGLTQKYVSSKVAGAWFGAHLIDWSLPVWAVEGPLDLLRLASLGELNVIASGGKGITENQFRALIGTHYIIAFDADKAGDEASKKALKYLSGSHTILVDWSDFGMNDPGDIPSKRVLREVKKQCGIAGKL